MHLLDTIPSPSPALPLPATQRLARLDTIGAPGRLARGFGASTAFLSLSPGLACVFADPDGAALTHQALGAAGMSAHQLWNAAAAELAARAHTERGVEFLVRSPAVTCAAACGGAELPRGFEVAGHGVAAAHWLAHPQTFTLLHRHFEAVLYPEAMLAYATDDGERLFVFDAAPHAVAAALPRADVVTYSVGFPLLYHPGRS